MAVLFISLLVLIIVLYAIPPCIRSRRIARRLAIDIKNQSQDLELQAAFALESPSFRRSSDDSFILTPMYAVRTGSTPSLMSFSSATEKDTGDMRRSDSMNLLEGRQLLESPRAVELTDTFTDTPSRTEVPEADVGELKSTSIIERYPEIVTTETEGETHPRVSQIESAVAEGSSAEGASDARGSEETSKAELGGEETCSRNAIQPLKTV